MSIIGQRNRRRQGPGLRFPHTGVRTGSPVLNHLKCFLVLVPDSVGLPGPVIL